MIKYLLILTHLASAFLSLASLLGCFIGPAFAAMTDFHSPLHSAGGYLFLASFPTFFLATGLLALSDQAYVDARYPFPPKTK